MLRRSNHSQKMARHVSSFIGKSGNQKNNRLIHRSSILVCEGIEKGSLEVLAHGNRISFEIGESILRYASTDDASDFDTCHTSR